MKTAAGSGKRTEAEKFRCRANFPSLSRIDDSVKIGTVAALPLHPSSQKVVPSFIFFPSLLFRVPLAWYFCVYQLVYKFAFILTYLVAVPRQLSR